MFLIWRFFLRLLPAGLMLSKPERCQIVKVTARKWLRHSRLSLAMQAAYWLAALSLILYTNSNAGRFSDGVLLGCLMFVVALWVSATVIVMLNWSYPQHLYTELRARGHNVCPKCGYLRTGLEDTAPCPECSGLIGRSTEQTIKRS